MFKITNEPRFTHPVRVVVPIDGGHEEQTFRVMFKVVPVEELGDTASLEGQQQLLKAIVCDFAELVGDDGEPLPFSDALRDRLIAVPYVRAAMIQTYLAAITKTRVGN